MEDDRRQIGTSNVPLILGLIASILNIPTMFISSLVGKALQFIGGLIDESSVSDMGGIIFILSVGSIIAGFVGASISKSYPDTGGGLLMMASIISVLLLFITFNFMTLVVMVLYVIATIIAYTQTRVYADEGGVPLVNPNEKIIKINIEHTNQNQTYGQEQPRKGYPSPMDDIISRKEVPPKNKPGNPYG